MTRSDDPLSDGPIRLSELRRLAYGELDDDAHAHLHARLEEDPEASDRLARLRAEAEDFEKAAHTAAINAIVDRLTDRTTGTARAVPLTRWPPQRMLAGAGLAAAAALAWVVIELPTKAPQTRVKGATRTVTRDPDACAKGVCPGLEMFVKDAAGIRRGVDGAPLRAGDWVQFRYRGAGHTHLFVVSVDDDGVVSPLYPDHRGDSVPIKPDGLHVLDGSVILDDAVGPERVYALFSDRPLRFDGLASALQAVSDPVSQNRLEGLDADVDQVSVLIYKVKP